MKNIDWSQAPDGATHGNVQLGSNWLRETSHGWKYFCEFSKSWRHCAVQSSDVFSDAIPRPTTPTWSGEGPRPTTPTWSGEGLPPVGAECTIENTGGCAIEYGHELVGTGERCQVLTNVMVGDVQCTVVEYNGGGYVFRASMVRPLKSPRERWVEAAEKLLSQCAADEPLSYLCALTYDAMQSGTLPLPEVDQ